MRTALIVLAAALGVASFATVLACAACAQAGFDDDQHGRGDDEPHGDLDLRLLADAGIDAYLDPSGRLVYRGLRP